MTLNVLAATSGFEGNLSAREAINAVTAGVRRALPDAAVCKVPIVEDGEGFAGALVEATSGSMHPVGVTGPYGAPVESHLGLLGGPGPRTVVVDAAAAAGLSLVAAEDRDPIRASSYGVGELLRLGLSAGAERILLACGSTLLCDGGVGMAQALGVCFLDDDGAEIRPGALELARIASIDGSKCDPRLESVQLDAAVNWRSVLLGPDGVARSQAPVKGTSPDLSSLLEEALQVYAQRLEAATGWDVGLIGGGGAGGGLGAAVFALLGGRLLPHFDSVMEYLAVEQELEQTDLVLLVDGAESGGAPELGALGRIARKAKLRDLPVVAVGPNISDRLGGEQGIDVAYRVESGEAGESKHLVRAAEEVMHLVRMGLNLGEARDPG